MSVAAPMVIGFLFGLLLERAGLTQYDRVAGVYRFTDLTLLQFLGSALVVGSFTVQAALSLGLVVSVPVMPTHAVVKLIGGVVVGAVMALAGFCPGTILAGAGAGQVDYLIPGVAGLLTGALGFGWSYESFMPMLKRLGSLDALTLPELLGVSPWLLFLLLLEIALVGFYAIERARSAPARTLAPRGSHV